MALPLFLLAAGASRRFGAVDKRFIELRSGCSMLAAMRRRGERAGLAVNIVLGADDVNNPRCADLGAPCWHASRASEGMGSSLAEGLARWLAAHELSGDEMPEALLLMPVDLPLLRVSTLHAVAQAAHADRIVRPHHRGRGGHPVAFGREFWPQLLALSGEQGAKGLIAANADRLERLEVDDEGIYLDADTPAQFALLKARLRDRG